MKQRHFITTLCLLMLFVASAWAQKNTLEIPDVTVAQGKSISLPVNRRYRGGAVHHDHGRRHHLLY